MLAIAGELALGGWNLIKMGFAALGRFLGSLNAQGVIGLIAALILAFAAFHEWGEARHWKKQSGRFEKLYRADEASFQRIAAEATDLKTKTDALTAKISSTLKERHNEDVANNAADARDLGLRGPGKAACPGHSGLAASPSGHVGATPVADASGPALPATDGAAVPWQWLVGRAQEHDDLLSEVKTWRDDDAQLRKAWPKSATNGK